MNSLRIVFMGTPDFALEALIALEKSPHEIICVYSQPPRPKGRGHAVQPSAVHAFAREKNIEVRTPLSLKDEQEQKYFLSLNADIAIVAAYGLILPKPILEAPKAGCINIHASLLPRWRGASPIQHAIWKGDSQTGVTLMQMEEGLDTGPMLLKKSIDISFSTTAQTLHDDLAQLGSTMIVEFLNETLSQEITEAKKYTFVGEKQNDQEASYASLLKKDHGIIDWTCSATQIDNQVRALNPWPGTLSISSTQKIKIKKVELTQQTTQEKPGSILNKEGHVACGEQSVLKIIELQPPGKKAMDFISALNGHYLQVGTLL